jgi:hypothetical protein
MRDGASAPQKAPEEEVIINALANSRFESKYSKANADLKAKMLEQQRSKQPDAWWDQEPKARGDLQLIRPRETAFPSLRRTPSETLKQNIAAVRLKLALYGTGNRR